MGAGRPSKLDKLNIDSVRLLAERGFTDMEMSQVFEVDIRTWHNWKKKKQEFFDSLKLGKDKADRKVERSLYEKACGYSHPDCHISTIDGKVVITETIKHYAPDTGACAFWLKNRKPDKWRDKNHLELSQNLEDLNDDQLDKKINELLRKQSGESESTEPTGGEPNDD